MVKINDAQRPEQKEHPGYPLGHEIPLPRDVKKCPGSRILNAAHSKNYSLLAGVCYVEPVRPKDVNEPTGSFIIRIPSVVAANLVESILEKLKNSGDFTKVTLTQKPALFLKRESIIQVTMNIVSPEVHAKKEDVKPEPVVNSYQAEEYDLKFNPAYEQFQALATLAKPQVQR